MSLEDIFVKLGLKEHDCIHFKPDDRYSTNESFIAWVTIDGVVHLIRTYLGVIHLLTQDPENCDGITVEISDKRSSDKVRQIKFVTIYNKGDRSDDGDDKDKQRHNFTNRERNASYFLTLESKEIKFKVDSLK